MEQGNSSQRERPSVREWVLAVAVIVAFCAVITPIGFALLEVVEATGDRIEQIGIIIDHAAEEAREEEGREG